MLRIRLFRIGKKHQPSYKIVVVDKKKAPKGGRFIDVLGFLNPKEKKQKIDGEKIKYWISKGAQPSDTVHNLLVKEKIIEDKKIDVHKKSKKKEKKPASAKAPAGKEEPKEEPKPEEKPKEKPAENIDKKS